MTEADALISRTWAWPDSQVVRVIDGDTLIARLKIDVGFYGTHIREQKLRLNRINAPELRTDTGREAKEFVEQTIDGHPVTVVTLKPYKYGDEWMCEVKLPDGGNLSDELVAAGLAVFWDGSGPRPGG